MLDLRGLITGIGSLPHKEAEPALDLIFKYTPQIPFWPQLPKRDMREGMVAQYSENFPCLKITKEGLAFDGQNKDAALERFYERIIANDADYFKISPDFALGLHKFYQRLEKINLKPIEFIKCQVTGPFTFAASINNEDKAALLHDPVFMQAVIKGLSMKALWQINLFRKFGKKIILFFDEPYLGCFGSAYTPVNREDVIKGLTELTVGIESGDVLFGVHCCGNTDWSIFTEVAGIDIISFDAYDFLDKLILYADNLKVFLQRAGILCWGIAPTQEFNENMAAQALVDKIGEAIKRFTMKGLEQDLLHRQMLVSPACGLGALDTLKSEKIFRLLSEISQLILKTA